jgi:hypothetical protein
MGRSRGGLTTKIHLLVDANGLPVKLKLSPGQAHDGKSASDMLGDIGHGQILLAGAAYDSDALRHSLACRGAQANVKPMPRRLTVPSPAVTTNTTPTTSPFLQLAATRLRMRFMSR